MTAATTTALARIDLVPRADGTMDDTLAATLDSAVAAAEANPEVRVILLAGTMPGIFIRHYSLTVLRDIAAGLRARGLRFDPARPTPETQLHRLYRRLAQIDKPIIAALNGTAMGGGFELALACDLRIAQRGPFLYGLPEINAGLFPGAGGTQRLWRALGAARALEFIMLGRTVGPERAAELGLVNEVADDAVQRGLELAASLAKAPPRALAHIKQLVNAAAARDLAAGMAEERTRFLDILVDDACFARLDETVRSGRPLELPPE